MDPDSLSQTFPPLFLHRLIGPNSRIVGHLEVAVLYTQLGDYSVRASGGNLLEQSLILNGPFAKQCDGFGELVAGWGKAVVNMRGDNWMNQSVEQSAFLQLP
jgi:hypothetical protein